MSSFAPSLADAKKAGIRVVRQEYPAGVAGVRLSLQQIAQRIREGATSPKVQGVAFDALRDAGFAGRGIQAGGARARASALLSFVRKHTLYAPDPPGFEYVKSAEAMLCLAPGLCIRGGDCFPEETLLLRDDFELVAIKDILKGDRIWGRGKWTTVQRTWRSGIKKLDTLVLSNGSHVPLSPEHHIFVGAWGAEQRLTVADARPGMRLPPPGAIGFGAEEGDPRYSYVEGLYLSEGWAESNRFAISGLDGGRKEALKHEVKAICDAFGVKTRWHRKYISVLDKPWANILAALGAHAPDKAASSLNLTWELASELLRGIMSDSAANTRGTGRTFSTTSRRMAIQVRVLHRMFGHRTSIRKLTPEQHGGFGKHDLYRIGVTYNTSPKFHVPVKIKEIHRGVAKANCYDITTEDGFVYLPEHDVTVSNCDDQVVLLGSMVMGVGIPVQVLKQTFGAGDQEHVLLEAQDDNGNWFPLDPSTDLQAGSKAPASSEFRLDPSNPSMIGLKGTPEAEFIGVGAISNFRFVGDVAPVVFWTPVNIGLAIVAGGIAVGATAGLVQRYRKKARR